MSTVSSRNSEGGKTKPSSKLTSFSISSILGESPEERRTGERHPETREETGSHRDFPTREATLSPRETVRVPASVFDPEATAKLAAMTAWYPWIFQQAKQYPHFPFVEGMSNNNNNNDNNDNNYYMRQYPQKSSSVARQNQGMEQFKAIVIINSARKHEEESAM